MAEWLYQNVTRKFNFTTEVCEQARFQITHGLLDQYRVKTAATSFNGLMKELHPVEFSDDLGILISEIAGWLLKCVLATGQQPECMYPAFEGAATSLTPRDRDPGRPDVVEWGVIASLSIWVKLMKGVASFAPPQIRGKIILTAVLHLRSRTEAASPRGLSGFLIMVQLF